MTALLILRWTAGLVGFAVYYGFGVRVLGEFLDQTASSWMAPLVFILIVLPALVFGGGAAIWSLWGPLPEPHRPPDPKTGEARRHFSEGRSRAWFRPARMTLALSAGLCALLILAGVFAFFLGVDLPVWAGRLWLEVQSPAGLALAYLGFSAVFLVRARVKTGVAVNDVHASLVNIAVAATAVLAIEIGLVRIYPF
ncbi:MAG: hypothetical protein RKE49_13625 [Oceanicaulis sp.]